MLYDKIEIVNRFMKNEIEKTVNFENKLVNINNKVLQYIIENYTSEAGVRGLKRCLESIYLKLNLDKLYEKNLFKNTKKMVRITNNVVKDILDQPKIHKKKIHKDPIIGVINGLYATSNGNGGITPIQVLDNFQESSGFNFKLTGSQGDVMKESVNCAYTSAISLINEKKKEFNIESIQEHIKKNFPYGFHVHAPSTSTPKDGPSAGCAFGTAFFSRIINKPIPNDIAMTGEIDVLGNVTKIGGLEYKLFGAKKAGVKKVFVPQENFQDVEEIKKNYVGLLDKNIKIVFVEKLEQVVNDIF